MLIQLCASHISCKKRIDTLCRQLDSILAQTIYAPFFLSISTIPELYTEVRSRLQKYTDIHIYFRPQLSQFEHYALLVDEIEEDDWCIFCDDDDFCHPDRVKWYTENIALNQNNYRVIFPLNGTLSVYIEGSLDMNFIELLNHGENNPTKISHTAFEYWMFAAHADVLREFFELNKNNIKNKFCDICFRNFLKTNCKFIKSDTWLYAKTMDVSFDHASIDLLN
jgi:hypothetical protein